MAIYKLNQRSTESEPSSVTLDLSNGKSKCIPLNAPDNTDYQTYLAWVADGNTADPAD